MKKIIWLNSLIAGAACVYASALYAQDAGIYIGFGIGRPHTQIQDITAADQSINYLINGPITRFTSSHDNGTNNSWTLFGGYQFNRFLAVEALYSTLGEYNRTAGGSGRIGKLGTPSDYHTIDDLKLDGFGLTAVASLPVTDRLSVFAKYGAFNWNGKLNHTTSFRAASLDPVASTDRANGYSPMLGAGARFKLKHGFSILGEWLQIDRVGGNLTTGSAKVQVAFAGVQLNF